MENGMTKEEATNGRNSLQPQAIMAIIGLRMKKHTTVWATAMLHYMCTKAHYRYNDYRACY